MNKCFYLYYFCPVTIEIIGFLGEHNRWVVCSLYEER